MDIDCLHHVSLPCSDLKRSRRFYQEVLRLAEIPTYSQIILFISSAN
jgi:extradiol dioxygenase family protein